MAQQTAIEWLKNNFIFTPRFEEDFVHNKNVFEKAKQMEKEQLKEAMMYALDEDGHTGEWKVKFVDNYYMSSFLHNKLDKDGFCTD